MVESCFSRIFNVNSQYLSIFVDTREDRIRVPFCLLGGSFCLFNTEQKAVLVMAAKFVFCDLVTIRKILRLYYCVELLDAKEQSKMCCISLYPSLFLSLAEEMVVRVVCPDPLGGTWER